MPIAEFQELFHVSATLKEEIRTWMYIRSVRD
jgi:hypothetical protein